MAPTCTCRPVRIQFQRWMRSRPPYQLRKIFVGIALSNWAPLLAAATGLVAVILAPLVQYRVFHGQRALALAERRQARADALRNELAEFLATASTLRDLQFHMFELVSLFQQTKDRPSQDKIESQLPPLRDQIAELRTVTSRSVQLLKMRLNPAEGLQRNLIEAISTLAMVAKGPKDLQAGETREVLDKAFVQQLRVVTERAELMLRAEVEALDRL